MKEKLLTAAVVLSVLLAFGALYRFFHTGEDERGATRLMQAIEKNEQFKDTARLIKRSRDINQRDKQGRTALFYAARHAQNLDLLDRLIHSGADVQAQDGDGQTALMRAARYNGFTPMTAELLKHGASADTADKQGNTALILSARYNTADVIKTLLRYRADPDAKNAEGKTAADYLSENPNLTDEQKTDYRQAMLVLSILQGVR